MSDVFKTGDAVTITCNGRTVPGSIVFASGNGRSLMLGFDAMLEGHAGMMPVLQDDNGYSSIMNGVTVEIRHEGAA